MAPKYKYSLSWARNRANAHYEAHPRATEMLLHVTNLNPIWPAVWLAKGDNLWEEYKTLIRLLELGLGIRQKPTTDEVLSISHAKKCVSILLTPPPRSGSNWPLTGLACLLDLRSTVLLGEDPPATFTMEPIGTADFSGQCLLDL